MRHSQGVRPQSTDLGLGGCSALPGTSRATPRRKTCSWYRSTGVKSRDLDTVTSSPFPSIRNQDVVRVSEFFLRRQV